MAAPIAFRMLGPVALEGPDGREAVGLLSQPRRLALLAYLAAATPRGFQRRDVVLTLFWPELDQEHARAALRQALRVIRGALGAVIVNRGDDEIGLDFERVSCDAVSFDSAVAVGRMDEALGLYRGDLLEGFFISDAPEFERWLDKERARLRSAAANGAQRHAEVLVAAGDTTAAVETFRRALELAPHDETLLRRAIELLDRLGDRGGAAQLYENFAQRLVADLDVEPAPETKRTMAAVRGRQAASPFDQPASPPVVPAKRTRRVSIAAMLGIAALVSLAAFFRSRSGAVAAIDPKRVVVAPFANRSGDRSLNQLGDLTAQWIARTLINTGVVEVADADATAPVDSPRQLARADTARGWLAVRALARAKHAGTAVSGSYYRRGDSLVFEAQIHDERKDELIGSVGPVVAPAHDPRPAVALLSQRVLGALAAGSDPRLSDWMRLASQPPSYEAYSMFAAGLAASNRLATQREALRAFYRAAALDSTFTLPLVWAAWIHRGLNECDKTDSLASVLHSRREGLRRLDQWYLDREVVECRGDMPGGYRISREIALAVPTSELSAELAARAALGVNRPREAIAILTRLHPDRDPEAGRAGFYYLWLTASYHLLGEHRHELAAAERFAQQDPERRLGMVRDELFALAALGRVQDVGRALDEIPAFPPHPNWKPAGVMRETAIELRVHGKPEASRAVFQRALAWLDSRPPEAQAAESSRFERLMTLYAAERWPDAWRVAGELLREHPESASYQGLWGAIAAQRGDGRAAAQADSVLASFSRPRLHGLPTYWRACIAARLGYAARAVALLQQAQAEGLQSVTFPVRYGVYGFLYYDYLHRDPSFEALHPYPPFRELIRPKG